MKKIICLIESLGSGGAERQLTGLAVMLKQQGYDVEVWTYYPNDFYLQRLKDGNVTYRYIPEAQGKKQRISVLRKELKRANPDTVVAYLDTACMVACIIKAMGAKFKLIVSERNTTQHLSRRERLKFFLYRFANYIVPNSHTQSEFIKENFPALTHKVICITNFVDLERFAPAQERAERTSRRILTVARVMPQKNVINYIQAIKIVAEKRRDFEVCWFGDSTNQEYYDECRRAIIEHKLEDIFKFFPATSNVIEEYHKSDIFCLPSLYEGFPNVVCEAMSCGLPVICSDVSDNSRIIFPNQNGFLFDPNNIESIAGAIDRIIACPSQQIESMRLSSVESSRAQFSASAFIDKYINII